ncbi:MAG: metallophosphoesterase [Anaerolineae bacterium]|nr:metallophosphoesterase [Anaerolineae bacterium]
MKILFVSDRVVNRLYSPKITERYHDIDLIVGCGDLPYYYLEYIVSMLNVQLVYVHGNHDPEREYLPDGTSIAGPGGGINLHSVTRLEKNLLLAGLEGSIRYKRGKFQYTQTEMWLNVFSLAPKLYLNKLRYGRYLDILVAHSPPYGIHNGEDHTHIGFEAFLWLMKTFKPRYLIHGHRHVYNPCEVTETQYRETKVINIYPFKILEIEPPA